MKRLSIVLCICVIFVCASCTIPKELESTSAIPGPGITPPTPVFPLPPLSTDADGYEDWLLYLNRPSGFVHYNQIKSIGALISASIPHNFDYVDDYTYVLQYNTENQTEMTVSLQVKHIDDTFSSEEFSYGNIKLTPSIWGYERLWIEWNTTMEGHGGDDLRFFDGFEKSFEGVASVDFYGNRYYYEQGKLTVIEWVSYGKIFCLRGELYKALPSEDNVMRYFLYKDTAPMAKECFETFAIRAGGGNPDQPDSLYRFTVARKADSATSDVVPTPATVTLRVSTGYLDFAISKENTGNPRGAMGISTVDSDILDYYGVRFCYANGRLQQIIWEKSGCVYTLEGAEGYDLSDLDDMDEASPFYCFLRSTRVRTAVQHFDDYVKAILYPTSAASND